MRVLHLGAGNLYGGIERVLGTLARCRHLAPEMEPTFALCFPGQARNELAAAGVAVHDLGAVRFSRPWTVLRARRRLAGVLAAGRFDTVMTHSCWPHAVFAPAVRRTEVRLVTWVHGDLYGRHWVERWAACTPPDLVIANSRFTAGMVPTVFPGVRTDLLYYPVELCAVADAQRVREHVRREFGVPAETVVILQASRLDWWKGHTVLVDALGLLRDEPNWACWIAGGPQRPSDAAYFADLQATAAALGVGGRVRFLGQRADVPRLMAAADLYCQPNTKPEPFGVAFVEALAAGLPVITTDFGGGAEVVADGCGVLVPPGDAAAVAGALRDLIRHPDHRVAGRNAGPARARELCDPPRQIGRLVATLAAK